jgi:hypothetical protein
MITTKELQKEIKVLFDNIPETINFPNSNIWAIICEGRIDLQNTTAQELITSIIGGEVPTQHSVAAAISCVRKTDNKYKLTYEVRKKRLEIKNQFAEDYRNTLIQK